MTKLCAVLAAVAAGIATLLYLTHRRQSSDRRLGTADQLLRQVHFELQDQRRTLRQHRGTLNDAHKLILAVSKGLQKQPR